MLLFRGKPEVTYNQEHTKEFIKFEVNSEQKQDFLY